MQTALRGTEHVGGYNVLEHDLRIQLLEHLPYLTVVLVASNALMIPPRDPIVPVGHLPMPADVLAGQRPRLRVRVANDDPSRNHWRDRLLAYQAAVEGIVALDLGHGGVPLALQDSENPNPEPGHDLG